MAGPLQGVKVIEMAGVGPSQFAGLLLADLGAEVIRIDRPGGANRGILDDSRDVLNRSRRSVVIDLKRAGAVDAVRALVRDADLFTEGLRPGVMERLGLGPQVLLADNPRLIYGRMTGWGQQGPLSRRPGHDINYIAVTGNLHSYGRAGDKPTPPINAVGDYGGGGMYMVTGLLAALVCARTSGQGQVVDCAMMDGAALLASQIWGLRAAGLWRDERGVNLMDTGAPFYDVYETADRKYLAVGALEPIFYRELLRVCGLQQDADFAVQMDPSKWPAMRRKLTALFVSRTRAQWCAQFEGVDACVSPVLSMAEALDDPHNLERGVFSTIGGAVQPSPGPRYSATPLAAPRAPQRLGADGAAVFREAGLDEARIRRLQDEGVLGV